MEIPAIRVPWDRKWLRPLRKGAIVTIPLHFPDGKVVHLELYPPKAWAELQTTHKSPLILPSRLGMN